MFTIPCQEGLTGRAYSKLKELGKMRRSSKGDRGGAVRRKGVPEPNEEEGKNQIVLR